MIRALPLLLALAYPVLAHAAAYTQNPTLVLAAGLDLVVLLLFEPLRRGRWPAWLALAVALLLLAWLHRQQLAVLPLYLPPVLLNVFMAWVFGHTLLAGRRPMIERLARAMEPDFERRPAEVAVYTRRLTLAWTLLFTLMALTSLVLALLAQPDGLLMALGVVPPVGVSQATWSLFANVLNYVAVAVFFVAEFYWRQHRFPDLPYRGLLDFLRRLLALGPAFWRGLAR